MHDPTTPFGLSAAAVLALTLVELCNHCAEGMEAHGTSITVGRLGESDVAFGATALVQELAEQQRTLGEGPQAEVDRSGALIVVSDLGSFGERWPTFVPLALALGVRGIVASPLGVGAVRLGVLTVYSDSPTFFDDATVRRASSVSESATHVLLRQYEHRLRGDSPILVSDQNSFGSIVHQATGMVSVQLQCSMADALVRLRAYAFANERTLSDVAQDVVRRKLRLEP